MRKSVNYIIILCCLSLCSCSWMTDIAAEQEVRSIVSTLGTPPGSKVIVETSLFPPGSNPTCSAASSDLVIGSMLPMAEFTAYVSSRFPSWRITATAESSSWSFDERSHYRGVGILSDTSWLSPDGPIRRAQASGRDIYSYTYPISVIVVICPPGKEPPI